MLRRRTKSMAAFNLAGSAEGGKVTSKRRITRITVQ
jgi:hypothetical protein